MLYGTITMVILYIILKYILAWIRYFNSLDTRLGQSTWRWSYDYPVVGERDVSDLDDKNFVMVLTSFSSERPPYDGTKFVNPITEA